MRFFRIAIYVLLAFSVLAYGCVEEWSQAVLEIGLAWLLVYWAVRQYRRRSEQIQLSPLFIPLATLALLVFIQMVFRTTASLYDTRLELQLLVAYLTLLLLLTQAFSPLQPYAWAGVVSDGLRIFRLYLRHPPVLHVKWQALLASCRAFWWASVWSLREPESFCRLCGVDDSHCPGALGPRKSSPRATIPGGVVRDRAHRGIDTVGLARGHRQPGRTNDYSFSPVAGETALRGEHMLVGGMVVLCAVLAVSWIGVQQVLQRFTGYQSLEVSAGKRAAMRADTWHIFLDHPLIGHGARYPPNGLSHRTIRSMTARS